MTMSRPAVFAPKSLAVAFALSLALAAAPARAGSIVLQPGAAGQIDVGDRYSYTTIDITNEAAAAGRIEIAGKSFDVPAAQNNVPGKIEVYDRYGRSTYGGSYITVTNTGAAPLRLISRYQMTYMTQ